MQAPRRAAVAQTLIDGALALGSWIVLLRLLVGQA
jgi:hypothetical protein